MILVQASTDLGNTIATELAARLKSSSRDNRIRTRANLGEVRKTLASLGWKRIDPRVNVVAYKGTDWPLKLETLENGRTQITVEGAKVATVTPVTELMHRRGVRKVANHDLLVTHYSYVVTDPHVLHKLAEELDRLGFNIVKKESGHRVYHSRKFGTLNFVKNGDTWTASYTPRPQTKI